MTTTPAVDEESGLRNLAFDHDRPAYAGARHLQIYEAYRAAIMGRRLRPGERVPSSRTLATELGVSRMPVLNAYAVSQLAIIESK